MTKPLYNIEYEIGAIPNEKGVKTRLMYLAELAAETKFDGLRYALLLSDASGDTLPLLTKTILAWENPISQRLKGWACHPPSDDRHWQTLRLDLAREKGDTGMRYAVATYLAPHLVTSSASVFGVDMFPAFAATVAEWDVPYFSALIRVMRHEFPAYTHLLSGLLKSPLTSMPTVGVSMPTTFSGPSI